MKIFKMLLPGLAILMMVNCVFAQTWTQTSAPSNDWVSVASSADGSKLVAAAGLTNGGDGLIYVSTNSGVDGMQTSAPSNSWSAVASSADGTKLVASASGDFIYTSTNSGFDWAATSAPSNSWAAVVSSADGATLAAAANGDGIYISTNSGLNWIESDAPITNWNSIACSADGTKEIAANGSQVWISEDSGATWTQTALPSESWSSVCSSADGKRLFAGASPGSTGTSTNSGTSWTTNNYFSAFFAMQSSTDGNKLVAAVLNEFPGGRYIPSIDISTNLGIDWIQETNLSASALASSADGNKLVVGTEAAYSVELPGGRIITVGSTASIYTSFSTPSPQLNLTPTNGSFKLSWIIPSTNFVMQQSSDLSSWSDLTNAPVLNLTNLQNEITLPLSGGNDFYRLKTP
jgi:hypothetical protein